MTTRGFTQFRNKLQSMERRLNRAESSVPRDAGRKGVSRMKRRLIQQDAVVSTELWRSLGYRMIADNIVQVHADAPYAGYVEHGTGIKGDGRYPSASNVPIGNILKWMHEKPTFTPWGDTFEENYAIAASIASDLEEEGQRQQAFFEPSFNDAKKHAMRLLRRELHLAFN